MKMVRFTFEGGKSVWINPKKITWVRADENGNTEIWVDTEEPFAVDESVLDVITMLDQQGG